MFEEKAKQLVEQMTVEEAAGQLKYNAPAIEHLGIPAYNWWNEALHGVARGGTATVFPQAIGLAAIFDSEMLEKIADVIATEARAKYNMQRALEDRDIYKGLTVWSPNINIFRDPRWGRGHETYGEDPYLTATLGVSFIKGLQGNGNYLKTAACAKHLAVHSGPETLRHSFNAVASPKDMEETYLPAFEAAVKEGGVESVMGAYNRTNGEPCCGSETLLKKILRKKWGFQGHVVSDCWAIMDFHKFHHITDTAPESAALAIKNGCDLNCGVTYLHLLQALEDGLIEETDIRRSAVRLFTTRMKLGMFSDDCEYDSILFEDNDTQENRTLSLEASRKSIVLLKNDGTLPLKRDLLKTVGVIGPVSDSKAVLEGNYNGTASEYITNLEGIREIAGEGIRILYSEGCHLFKDRLQSLAQPGDRIAEAVAVAKASDIAIVCVGLDATIEGEEGDTGNSFAGGDKNNLLLPESQRQLISAVAKTGTPMIIVLNAGSAIDLSAYEDEAAAIVQCWYSGSLGGRALGEILFGDVIPSGRLPVTFYYDGDLPDFTDYSMAGRTYRYLKNEPWRPFGFGLSYTSMEYSGLKLDESEQTVSFEIKNTGSCDAEEVYQIYLANNIREKAENETNTQYLAQFDIENQPVYSLAGFGRVFVKQGGNVQVTYKIPQKCFETVLEDGSRAVLSGIYTVYAGGSQPDKRSCSLLGKECLQTTIRID